VISKEDLAAGEYPVWSPNVRENTVEIQHQETTHGSEIERSYEVVSSLSTTQAEEAVVAHAAPDPDSLPRRQQRELSNSERWLLGHPLDFRSCWSSKAREEDQLQHMEFEEVLGILRKESLKLSKVWIYNLLMVSIYVALALLLAKFAHNRFLLDNWTGFLGGMVSWVVVSDRAKSAAVSIARFDDVRAVGPLAQALWFKDRRVASIASGALIRLLPRLQASDAFLLSPAQRSCMNRALRGKNIELTMAILKAWEQVGDADAIPEVENLAEGRGKGGRFSKVVEAAKACLPFLRQSAERQRIGAQLLRPANGNLTPTDTLLRPALPHTSTEPSEQLLRPTDAT